MSKPPEKLIPTEEEMAEAMAKDRGCCFLHFYRLSKMIPNLQQVYAVCPECNIQWCCGRLGVTLLFTPMGVEPKVKIETIMPGTTRH